MTDLLLESFNDLFDVNYTARMEEELDEIEEGKIDWRVAMAEFYERFQKDLEHAARHMTDIKRMEKPTDLICEKCGKPMVIKWGRHGSFIACTGYPDCTNTRELTVDLPDVEKADLGSRTKRNIAKTADVRWFSRRAASDSSLRAPAIRTARPPSRSAASRRKDVPLDEKCPQCGKQSGPEVWALRRVRGVQQLSEVQVREAEDHWRALPELLAKARSWSGGQSAARRSTAATDIPIAISSPGASRFRKNVRIAAAAI